MLFRREVFEAQEVQRLGSVRVELSLRYSILTGIAVALALALLTFSIWGQVYRKSTATGLLAPTDPTTNVTSTQAAIVAECHVSEGQAVRAGEVLFVLDLDRATRSGDTAALVARQLETRRGSLLAERGARELQARQRKDALMDRARSTEAELRKQADEISTQGRREQLARASFERYEQLGREKFMSQAQVQQKQDEWLDAGGRLQSLERGRLALSRDLRALKAEIDQVQSQLDAELAQVARAAAAVEQEVAENDSRRQQVVMAPRDATVTSLHVRAGQQIPANQALASLVPAGAVGQTSNPLQAHLYVPSQKAAFIEPGQRVYLRYSAYPYQKFGMFPGTVSAITATPLSPNELPPGLSAQLMSQAQSTEALYRVTVAPDHQTVTAYGRPQTLRPGMTLEADVLHEKRAVWEWVFEPILAAREKAGILSGAPDGR